MFLQVSICREVMQFYFGSSQNVKFKLYVSDFWIKIFNFARIASSNFLRIQLKEMDLDLFWFDGISIIEGHIMPKLFYTFIRFMISK